jgi:hypothetical protein
MKSDLWTQFASEIRNDPQFHECQELFLKEASLIIEGALKRYHKYQLQFWLDECTLKKSLWMLHLDAIDTLRECIFLLKQKKHRLVGKLFRDIIEILDLAYLFWKEKDKKPENLAKWYKNEVVPHRKFRDHLKKGKGLVISEYAKKIYAELSAWTHHSYSTLLNSYSLGGKDRNMLAFDGYSDVLVSRDVILRYTWQMKDLILYFLDNVKSIGLVDWNEFADFLNNIIKGLIFTKKKA